MLALYKYITSPFFWVSLNVESGHLRGVVCCASVRVRAVVFLFGGIDFPEFGAIIVTAKSDIQGR